MGWLTGFLDLIAVIKELLAIAKSIFGFVKEKADIRERQQMAKDLKEAITQSIKVAPKGAMKSTEAIDIFFGKKPPEKKAPKNEVQPEKPATP